MAHKVDQGTTALHVATCTHTGLPPVAWVAKGDASRGVFDGERVEWCQVCGALWGGGSWREPIRASLLRAALRVVVEASDFQARAAAVIEAARGSASDLLAFREGVEGERRRGSEYEAAAYQRVARTLDPARTAGVQLVPSCALHARCVFPSGHPGRCGWVEPDDHT